MKHWRESRRAAELEPDQTRYAYVYAVGPQSAGREAEAIAALKENLGRHPSGANSGHARTLEPKGGTPSSISLRWCVSPTLDARASIDSGIDEFFRLVCVFAS